MYVVDEKGDVLIGVDENAEEMIIPNQKKSALQRHGFFKAKENPAMYQHEKQTQQNRQDVAEMMEGSWTDGGEGVFNDMLENTNSQWENERVNSTYTKDKSYLEPAFPDYEARGSSNTNVKSIKSFLAPRVYIHPIKQKESGLEIFGKEITSEKNWMTSTESMFFDFAKNQGVQDLKVVFTHRALGVVGVGLDATEAYGKYKLAPQNEKLYTGVREGGAVVVGGVAGFIGAPLGPIGIVGASAVGVTLWKTSVDMYVAKNENLSNIQKVNNLKI